MKEEKRNKHMATKVELSPDTIKAIEQILASGNEAKVTIESGVITVYELIITEAFPLEGNILNIKAARKLQNEV